MKRTLIEAAVIFCSALGAIPTVTAVALEPAELAIMPKPMRVQRTEGAFVLGPATRILIEAGSAEAANAGRQLAATLNRSTGFRLKVSELSADALVPGAILLTTKNANPQYGPEGYTLEVTAKGVIITARTGAGLLYGTQTLLQLLPPAVFSTEKVSGPIQWTVPVVRVEDQPRFAWRGLLLDVGRHFFNKEEIKNFLDLMALHKLNTFHWHLTDDQGWRIEIKRYPELTKIGGWRAGIGFGLDPKAGTAYGPDGRYGGFYTQDDIREIVAYAQSKHITIVPEIEMPGHAVAALAAHPELSCSGGPYNTDITAGVHAGVYCAGNDDTFEFLQNVLAEVIELFPSTFIHIGGDEVPKGNWQKCAKCQARIKQAGLKNEHELQSYFVRRIEKLINAKSRRLIGWSEIREGGLAQNATVMDWIGGAVESARAGHDVVMTPTSYCYLDYYQAKTGEPKAIGGFVPLEKVYSFEPVPAALTGDETKHILGAQGNLWSEYFPNYKHVQYMAFPRACAMAELTWTRKELKNWDDFQMRLTTHLCRLDALGVNYRSTPPAGFEDAISGTAAGVELKRFFEGGEIRYTLDGADPTRDSPFYTGPIKIAKTATLKARYFKPNSPASFLAEATIVGSLPAKVAMSWGTYQDNTLDRAFDGRDDTYFWNNADIKKGDRITFTLLAPKKLNSIRVVTGKPDRPNDKMHDGDVIEASTDGQHYQKIAEFEDAVATGTFPNEPIRSLRLRATQGGKYWLVIREITID